MSESDQRSGARRGRELGRRQLIAGMGGLYAGLDAGPVRATTAPQLPQQTVPQGGGQAGGDETLGPPRTTGVITPSLAERLGSLPIAVEEFGAKGDGETDDTDAFVLAIREAIRRRNATVALSGGRSYRIGRTLTIPQGVAIIGPGSQGTTPQYGCSIRHTAHGDLFVWDGSGAAFAGTGGGLRNVLIVKAAGFQGGAAITLIARDPAHRPGEMLFENIVVYGESRQGLPGVWDHGVVIDGRQVDIEGTRGVRSTRWIACRFAGARVTSRTILLRQATHAYFLGCAVDQGGPATVGVTLEGRNDNIHFVAMGLGGDLLIAGGPGNSVRNFHFSGKIGGRLINDDPGATGSIIASFDPPARYVLINQAAELRILSNIDPAFRLVLNKLLPLKIESTPVVVGWDKSIYDRGNNIKVRSDGYVCSNAGLHRFSTQILTVAMPYLPMAVAFVRRRANGERELVSAPFEADREGEIASATLSASFDLAFGDSVSVALFARRPAHGATAQLLGWDPSVGLGCWFEGNLQE